MSATTSVLRGRSHQPPTSGGLKPLLLGQPREAGSSGPSNTTLFLTNLRLLDLDLREDWPDITTVTFSTKDAQQNQKKRIQCVEWALYRLFEIWDPDETRHKLKPFFPPLDPLQSLNLRAALFRCLEQAKKASVLGRDTVLRKTMLDECKGERLDEVLTVFSTVVVKKVVREHSASQAIAPRLAMENFSYTGERTALSTLILAYKSSLSRSMAAKNLSKADYKDFTNFLDLKERQITRRHEQLKIAIQEQNEETLVSEQDASELQMKAKKNWTGSNEWLETILSGDSRFKRDGVLERSFDRVWNHIENGSLGDIEDQHQKGLLEQLESRVKEQNHRLARWQAFERSLSNVDDSASAETKPSNLVRSNGIDLGFGAHQILQMPHNPAPASSTTAWAPLDEYARLIENLQKDLADIGKSRPCDSKPLCGSIPDQRKEDDTADLPFNSPSYQSHDLRQNSPSDVESEEQSPGFEKYVGKSTSQTPPSEDVVDPCEYSTKPRVEVTEDAPYKLTKKRPTSVKLANLPSLATPSESPAASEIIASVLTTSPSPTKPRHVLSLAERTRLSMSRRITFKSSTSLESDSDDIPELTTFTQNLRRASKPQPTTNEVSVISTPQTAHEDLVARTRQSLSGMAAVEKKARIERRRSVKAAERSKRDSRTSYFPKHLETTVEDDGILDDGVDKKKLIDGEVEVDYESVFKARPKIKTSPVTSPAKTWGSIGTSVGVVGDSSPTSGEY